VIQGIAEKMEFPEDTFDLVVAWMVVEHLHNPLEALKRIANVLKKSGIFAFSVPNAGSWEFKLFKGYWRGLHLPNHLYHFTIQSLRLLLKKAGLQMERIIFQKCMRNVMASLGFVLRESWGETMLSRALIRYPEEGRWYTQMLLMPLCSLEAVLKQSGRITIWARKL
jgi:SAM-dependent methyltransferase